MRCVGFGRQGVCMQPLGHALHALTVGVGAVGLMTGCAARRCCARADSCCEPRHHARWPVPVPGGAAMAELLWLNCHGCLVLRGHHAVTVPPLLFTNTPGCTLLSTDIPQKCLLFSQYTHTRIEYAHMLVTELCERGSGHLTSQCRPHCGGDDTMGRVASTEFEHSTHAHNPAAATPFQSKPLNTPAISWCVFCCLNVG